MTYPYINRPYTKARLKQVVLWSYRQFGAAHTVALVERLKELGFASATRAGLSLGVDDLLIPPTKFALVHDANRRLQTGAHDITRANLTHLDYSNRVIATWTTVNETLRRELIHAFQSSDALNPVFMMAYSGARGNISQVRQLVGMRGLMADPNGEIINFAIRSNFREGLSLTEYMIACYGSRKGVVDTALRTATSGYLTRRLVDVAQHMVTEFGDCQSSRGLTLTPLVVAGREVLSLQSRLIGRVLSAPVAVDGLVLRRNREIDPSVARRLASQKSVRVRSPLTCAYTHGVCKLCYGWNLARGCMVSLGQTVGVIAAQSIGEPGTQLTMRTFHTGGVFSGEAGAHIAAPCAGRVDFPTPGAGIIVRSVTGAVGYLVKTVTILRLHHARGNTRLRLPAFTLILVKQGQRVAAQEILAEPVEPPSDPGLHLQTYLSPCDGEIQYVSGTTFVANRERAQTNVAQFKRSHRHRRNADAALISVIYKWHMRRRRSQRRSMVARASRLWVARASTQPLLGPGQAILHPGDRFERRSAVTLTALSLDAMGHEGTRGSGRVTTPRRVRLLPDHLTIEPRSLLGLYLAWGIYARYGTVTVHDSRRRKILTVPPRSQAGLRLADANDCFGAAVHNDLRAWYSVKPAGTIFRLPQRAASNQHDPNHEATPGSRYRLGKPQPGAMVKPYDTVAPSATRHNSSTSAGIGPDLTQARTWTRARVYVYQTAGVQQLKPSVDGSQSTIRYNTQAQQHPEEPMNFTMIQPTLSCLPRTSDQNVTLKLSRSCDRIRGCDAGHWHRWLPGVVPCPINLTPQSPNNRGVTCLTAPAMVCLDWRHAPEQAADRGHHRYRRHGMTWADVAVRQKKSRFWPRRTTTSLIHMHYKKRKTRFGIRRRHRCRSSIKFARRSAKTYLAIEEQHSLNRKEKILLPAWRWPWSRVVMMARLSIGGRRHDPNKRNAAYNAQYRPGVVIPGDVSARSRALGQRVRQSPGRGRGSDALTYAAARRPYEPVRYLNWLSRISGGTIESYRGGRREKLAIKIVGTMGKVGLYGQKRRMLGKLPGTPCLGDLGLDEVVPLLAYVMLISETFVGPATVGKRARKFAPDNERSLFRDHGTLQRTAYDLWQDRCVRWLWFYRNDRRHLQRHGWWVGFDAYRSSFRRIQRCLDTGLTGFKVLTLNRSSMGLTLRWAWKVGRKPHLLRKDPVRGDYRRYQVHAWTQVQRTTIRPKNPRAETPSYHLIDHHEVDHAGILPWPNAKSRSVCAVPAALLHNDGIIVVPKLLGPLWQRVGSGERAWRQPAPTVRTSGAKVSVYGAGSDLTVPRDQPAQANPAQANPNSYRPGPGPGIRGRDHRDSPRCLRYWRVYVAAGLVSERASRPGLGVPGLRSHLTQTYGRASTWGPLYRRTWYHNSYRRPDVPYRRIQSYGLVGFKSVPSAHGHAPFDQLGVSGGSSFSSHVMWYGPRWLQPNGQDGFIEALTLPRRAMGKVILDHGICYHDRNPTSDPALYGHVHFETAVAHGDMLRVVQEAGHIAAHSDSTFVNAAGQSRQALRYLSVDHVAYVRKAMTPREPGHVGDYVDAYAKTDAGCYPEAGQALTVDRRGWALRRAESRLLPAQSRSRYVTGDFVHRQRELLTVTYHNLTTGDIVQGIPKIERLFEGRRLAFRLSLPRLLATVWNHYRVPIGLNPALQDRVQWRCLQVIQRYAMDEIQYVYQSQGVVIGDKHLEVILRQMTAKVRVVHPGDSGLLPGDFVHPAVTDRACQLALRPPLTRPFLRGITETSLEGQGFLSPASFQETVRMLTRAAIGMRSDFLRGLKERVILGDVLAIGTRGDKRGPYDSGPQGESDYSYKQYAYRSEPWVTWADRCERQRQALRLAMQAKTLAQAPQGKPRATAVNVRRGYRPHRKVVKTRRGR